ncbi:MAG: ATP-binding protein [Candidatus Obscuribacterales bacterium]
MKSKESISKSGSHSSSLAAQGILLVALLLVSELVLIGALAYLLTQAEAEASRQERARLISSKANRLYLIGFDTGDNVTSVSRSIELGTTDSVSAPMDESLEIIGWLKSELKDKQEAQVLLARIEKNFKVCIPVLSAMEAQRASLADEAEREKWQDKRHSIMPTFAALIEDIPALLIITRKLESEGPERERHIREQTEGVLAVGLLLTVLVVLLIGYLFSSRVTARLAVINDNIARLKDGRNLLPQLKGHDEIALVDAVIHETASTLRQEIGQLKASEARVRELIENLPVGIAMLDHNGAIEFLNSTLEADFNYSSHQLLGKRIAKLFAPGQDMPDVGPSMEYTAVSRDGEQFPADFMMAAVQIDGEPKTLALIIDASEKHAIKKMRQCFVSMVHSELKEPLTDVGAFLNKLGSAATAVSPKAVNATKQMQQNIERLIELLNDLFDLDRLEAGKIDIDPAMASLTVIFERSVSAVAMFAQKHQVQLQVAECQIELLVDASRLVQVLVNLLSNAIKFSPPGSVVSIATRLSASHVEIGVIDHGRGIPQSHIESIFEAYSQVEIADGQAKGGTGLGLAICKAIVEAHQGQIGVNSELGKGSVFWLKLPRSAEEAK